MAYSKAVNIFDELHSKRPLEICQGENPTIVNKEKSALTEGQREEEKKKLGAAIAGRLKSWLKTDKPSKVAQMLSISHTNATNYLAGRVPETFVLWGIKNQTGVSLDWLIMGEGESGELAEPHAYLGEHERNAIEKLAGIEKKEFEDVLQELVSYALVKRAADLLSGYEHLKTTDRQKLLAIYPLLLGEEAQADILKPRSKRR